MLNLHHRSYGCCYGDLYFSGKLDGDLLHLSYGSATLIFPFCKHETVGDLLDMVSAETSENCSVLNEGNCVADAVW